MKSSRSISAVAAPHCDQAPGLTLDHEIGVAVEATAPGDATISRISGDLDVLAAPSFALALADLAQDGAALVIDMTGVDFVGTSALSVLSTFAESARQRHMTWALAGNRAVLRPIQATGLHTMIPTCDSVREALELVDARGQG
ncbi:STAS domain-containing protein [Rhodococcus tibetensis]|uniref:Anti-sigma factor antagonist n=1 Tax=Rhodococcus tibetensis TaxID=2965064 RepID=A0ABT1QJX7_9NOCA|nr:STAS domain-containing protein [Rhodococcus sp. FXJ9.536]MCQ4122512.1 STAS domain-containing protein [Rhodococcus sp. FXJ9.536]